MRPKPTKPGVEEIVSSVLGLPEPERVKVMERLLVELEPIPDEDVDQAWAAEIDRRTAEIESGSVRPVTWDEVRKRTRGRRQ